MLSHGPSFKYKIQSNIFKCVDPLGETCSTLILNLPSSHDREKHGITSYMIFDFLSEICLDNLTFNASSRKKKTQVIVESSQ